jgi:hypothetical protein
MKKEFSVYGNDLRVKINITKEKKKEIIKKLLKFMKQYDCVDSETLHQNDDCLIESPMLVSDMIDILKPETEWIDEN